MKLNGWPWMEEGQSISHKGGCGWSVQHETALVISNVNANVNVNVNVPGS